MAQMVTIALMVLGMLATSPRGALGQSAPSEGHDTLTQAVRGAWLPLESGLAVSGREGTPVSAKYEIDDGAFQLSVYTWKADDSSGDAFAEVIVDHDTGGVSKVDTITDGGDLAAAQSQRAAMAIARRSLAEATAAAVLGNAGYRAVSAMPRLVGGRPVAEVTLVRGDDWKVVTEQLD
jgi:hypothetical protein